MDNATSKRAFWQSHIQAWQDSGQVRKAYCRAHGLNVHTFDHWRTKLQCKPPLESTAVTLVPLRVTTPSVIDIRCGHEVVVSVPGSVTPAWLIELIRGLRAC